VKRRRFMASSAGLTGLTRFGGFAATAAAAWLWPGTASAAAPAHASSAASASGTKTLRYAFPAPESTFDPPSTNSDFYSTTLISQILEAPLTYDYLARPVRLVANTAQELPEISADGLTITLRIRPGIYFAEDPAFRGSSRLDAQGRRELTAEDYVYSIKRFVDRQYASSDLYIF